MRPGIVSRARHEGRLLGLRLAWARGERRAPLPEEPADPEFVHEGQALQRQAVAAARDRHRGLPLRVFLVCPPSITARIWFEGLCSALRHMGLRAELAAHDDASWSERWRALQPTLLLAPDDDATRARLGLDFLANWARAGGRRLVVPMSPAGFPNSAARTAEDEERVRLGLAGRLADGYFSLFEREYFPTWFAPLAAAGLPYLSLPQACDPLQDAPRDLPKRHAWFVASVQTRERVEVAWSSLRPVLRRYRGHWVGRGWRFGDPPVPPSELPALFARARIALAPLVPWLRERPLELTYRVFAAAANGAFQITSRTPITARHFAEDELVQARSDAEFARLFEHYVDRPAERLAVARRAMRRAFASHTTFERALRLVEFVRTLPLRQGAAP